MESVQKCPKPEHMGEFACANKGQCWEPCGELGKDSRFVSVVNSDIDARITRVLNEKPA